DQRATGAGVAGPVRGDLRTEERPGATPEDVRRRDPGGDRHRTTKSPGRILGAFMPNLVDKAKQGVRLKYAFCFTPDNRGDVTALLKIAEVRHIDFMMPVYMHVFDGKEFLMSHPIPDDDSSYRGDDIAIWTDDPA